MEEEETEVTVETSTTAQGEEAAVVVVDALDEPAWLADGGGDKAKLITPVPAVAGDTGAECTTECTMVPPPVTVTPRVVAW